MRKRLTILGLTFILSLNFIITGNYSIFKIQADKYRKDYQLNLSIDEFEWDAVWGNANNEEGRAITYDSFGNIYVAGSTELTSSGQLDICIIKFDSSGTQLWNRTWGGNQDDFSHAIAIDSSNNLYIAGYTSSFSAVGIDICLIKYDSTGSLIWNQTWGGDYDDVCYAMVLDSSDDIILAGYTTSFNADQKDALLVKFNSSGSFLWKNIQGGSNDQEAFSVALDSSENIFLAGYTIVSGFKCVYIVKFNKLGTYIIYTSYGGGGTWIPYAITIDSSDAIYVAGKQNVVGAGGFDVFLLKYTSAFQYMWDRIWGGSGDDICYTMIKDYRGNVYLAGERNKKMFLLKFHHSGAERWYKIWGGTINDVCYALSLDNINNFLLAGFTESYGSGAKDIYILKYHHLLEIAILIDDLNPNLNWNKTATLREWCSGSGTKEDPYNIINIKVDGEFTDHCLEIRNSNVFFIIENCTFYNAGVNPDLYNIIYYAGIFLFNVSNGFIVNNTCSPNNSDGIYIENCYNNNISKNTLSNNFNSGIKIYQSNNNVIYGNIGNNNYHYEDLPEANGLILENSEDNKIINNSLNDNELNGIDCDGFNNSISNNIVNGNGENGIYFVGSNYNKVIGNIIKYNDKSGIYLYQGCLYDHLENNTIEYGVHGIRLFAAYIDCSYHKIINNTVMHNNVGIGLYSFSNVQCRGNLVSNNTIKYSLYNGIVLDKIKYTNISHNLILNNGRGITLYYSDHNIFKGNSIKVSNEYGIYSSDSYDNLFYLNQFNNNVINAYDMSINNFWNNSVIGNYWDDYSGFDINDDGIGDQPYNFTNGIDWLPIYHDGPTIHINSPNNNEIYSDPPSFNIKINDENLDTIWYTINSLPTMFIIFNNGTVDNSTWLSLSDGNVVLRFYANDSFGNINFNEVNIIKDTILPDINIVSPSQDEFFGSTPPDFQISFTELNLDSTWYYLGLGTNEVIFSGFTGTTNKIEWDKLGDGPVTIRFYINDTGGLENFDEIVIQKDLTPPTSSISYIPYKTPNIVNKSTSFSLIANDGIGSGVAVLRYKINNSNWYEYTGPFDLSSYNYGNYLITYQAIDEVGNVESENTLLVLLVKIPSKEPAIPGFSTFLILSLIGLALLILIKRFKK